MNISYVRARKMICRDCPHQCQPYLTGAIDHYDPKAKCPVDWPGRWWIRDGDAPPRESLDALTKEERGNQAWAFLHAKAKGGLLSVALLGNEFRAMIPIFGCGCLKEWDEIMTSIRFRPGDQVQWAIDVHNAVNVKIGKPLWKP